MRPSHRKKKWKTLQMTPVQMLQWIHEQSMYSLHLIVHYKYIEWFSCYIQCMYICICDLNHTFILVLISSFICKINVCWLFLRDVHMVLQYHGEKDSMWKKLQCFNHIKWNGVINIIWQWIPTQVLMARAPSGGNRQ